MTCCKYIFTNIQVTVKLNDMSDLPNQAVISCVLTYKSFWVQINNYIKSLDMVCDGLSYVPCFSAMVKKSRRGDYRPKKEDLPL